MMSKNVSKGLPLLMQGQTGEVWRLLHGVMVVKRETAEESTVISLALPGDLLGLEAAGGLPYSYTTSALSNAWVMPDRTACQDTARTVLLDGLLQQQRQGETMLRLRTGAIRDRVGHLLRLLAQSLGGHTLCATDAELPTLRDFSGVLGIAVETACRELNGFLPDQIRARHAGTQLWSNKLAQATQAVGQTL